MTTVCTLPGWGEAPWGEAPWGGSLVTPGGALPVDPPFDIFCVGLCGAISVLTTYTDVSEAEAGTGQLTVDPLSLDFVMSGGGSLATTSAYVFVDVAVPSLYTLELTLLVDALPDDFSDLVGDHLYVGVANETGMCAGLFFSKVGILYTGSIRHSGLNLVLNSAVQLLPDSVNLILPGTYYTLRLVVDAVTSNTYVYITETSQIPISGHKLCYVLPSIPSSSCLVTPVDGVTLSACGTVVDPVQWQLASICLGTGLLIPNLPPIAVVGADQSLQLCNVVKLDGRASFDPEGSKLLYKWRLISGPDVSSFVRVAYDGMTCGGGLTNRLYSVTLSAYFAFIAAGDVLSVGGVPHNITGIGTDSHGFYVQIDGYSLTSGLINTTCKVLLQGSIAGVTSPQPTFYPDVVGLYLFDLTVFDGGLYSPAVSTLLNVVDSQTPYGCTPDLSFIWNYLSDFWKLVDNTDSLPVFWSALAQVVATELLTLWQYDYSKSLRDIQRTFQRRWLHYDLYLAEPSVEKTTTRLVLSGVTSLDLTVTSITTGGSLVVSSPIFKEPQAVYVRVGSGPLPPYSLVLQLQKDLSELDSRFIVGLSTDGAQFRICITAPFPFTLDASSTSVGVFTPGSTNGVLRGIGGVAVGTRVYCVERNLFMQDIQEGDYLVLDGVAYRITSLIAFPTDPWGYQRLVLSEDLPLVCSSSWSIVGVTKSVEVDYYSALVSAGDTAVFEATDIASGIVTYVGADVISAASTPGTGTLLLDPTDISGYFSQPDVYHIFLSAVFRRSYLPIDPLVVGVPRLQENIKEADQTVVLRQNIDYSIDDYRGRHCLHFVTGVSPSQDVWEYGLSVQRMWAEVTYLDNNPRIEQNFGLQAEFTLGNLESSGTNIDYLSAIRGLWYSYLNGPTLHTLRVGIQILLGLPFAEEAGTIVEINTTFSPSQGRILVEDASNQAIVRSYVYPRPLGMEVNPATGIQYVVGDAVEQFAPMVVGAEIVDYISDPTWFQGYLNQGVFWEVEKLFKFLVRVDSSAFSLLTLSFVQAFVLKIKPTYTFPLFIIAARLGTTGGTEIDVIDTITSSGKLILNDNIGYLGDVHGPIVIGGALDDPRAAGGGWVSALDSGYPVIHPPVPLTEHRPEYWGIDRIFLCPEEVIIGGASATFPPATLPTLDNIFALDTALEATDTLVFSESSLVFIPTREFPLGPDVTLAAPLPITDITIEYKASGRSSFVTPIEYKLYVDTVLLKTIAFTVPAGTNEYRATVPLAGGPYLLDAAQVVRVTARSGTVDLTDIPVASLLASFSTHYYWRLDTFIPAGTYTVHKQL